VLANDQLVIESAQVRVYEEPFDTPLGSRIILSTKGPLFDNEGQIVGIVGVAKDITKQKKREEEIELLHNELSHRLRNSLALIQAMARQTVKRGDGLDQFEERLLGYARSQKLVLERGGRGVLLRELINAHRSALNMADRVSVEGTDVVLSPHFATQIGFALHELATNSVKYGALGGYGRVDVRWILEKADEHRQYLALSWHEVHDRLQLQRTHRGFGHDVLTRIIPARLNALASLEINIGELRWTLRAELKD
jgi:two-component sensor histidine kinase